MREITVAELAQHKSQTDCWVAIYGKVYDVTDWLEDHPGGVEIVVDASGADASAPFDEVGHSDFAKSHRDKYYIGDLVGSSSRKAEAREATPGAHDESSYRGPAPDDSDAYLFAAASVTALLAFAVYLVRK